MSFEPDDNGADRTASQQNEEIICLLKAILLGIEAITDQDNLIDQVED